jgi:hypothetical protein
MGHYWSEMQGEPTPDKLKLIEAEKIAKELRKYEAGAFTVNELAVLMRTNWSSVQEDYHKDEVEMLFAMRKRIR